MRAYIDTNAEPLARAVGGVRGAGTEADVQRAKAIFAEVGETFGFRMKGWIPTFQWNRPDTRAVALGKLNAFNQTLDKRTGNLLGNPQFEHPGLLPRMSLEQGTTEGQKTSGAIGPYQPEVGPQGLTPAQIKATPTRPPRTAQEAPGLSPTDAMQQVQQTSLKQHGLTRPPAAATQPAEFKAYMRTVRQQIGRYFPKKTPAQQEELTQLIAQKLGGTWPVSTTDTTDQAELNALADWFVQSLPPAARPPVLPGTAPSIKRHPLADPQSAEFQAMARQYGHDPAEVARMMGIESGGDPIAVSKKGAKGLFQLMDSVQKDYGVTDPFDPAQNVPAGHAVLAGPQKALQGRQAPGVCRL